MTHIFPIFLFLSTTFQKKKSEIRIVGENIETTRSIFLNSWKEWVSKNEECEHGAIISFANIDNAHFGSMFKKFVDIRSLNENINYIIFDWSQSFFSQNLISRNSGFALLNKAGSQMCC